MSTAPARCRPSRSAFAGFRFPAEVIVIAVRWCLRYHLSYRDIEQLLVERGVEVDHVSVFRWTQRFTPLLADAVGARWSVGWLRVFGLPRGRGVRGDRFGDGGHADGGGRGGPSFGRAAPQAGDGCGHDLRGVPGGIDGPDAGVLGGARRGGGLMPDRGRAAGGSGGVAGRRRVLDIVGRVAAGGPSTGRGQGGGDRHCGDRPWPPPLAWPAATGVAAAWSLDHRCPLMG